MSTQLDVDFNAPQYILYYCNFINSDSKVYQTDLSDVCTLSFDPITSNAVFSNWLISAYPIPNTTTDLLTYTLSDVLAFYNNWYIIPIIVAADQYYQISTANLAHIRADASMLGYRIFDITSRTVKYWSGTAWV